MSKNVFANGNEISAKKDDNKSIAAMPDTCLSPPSPPAGPVPLPYPNTAEASDTTNGSKTVKIGGSEVGMKNSSSYKKSTGDEAATKSLGMGVVSHNIQGKMKHAAWSFDVKIEGANAIRHMDMTTHNHLNPGNADPGIDLAQVARTRGDDECTYLEQLAHVVLQGESTVRDAQGKVLLPRNVALVTARASNGSLYVAATPPDNMSSRGADGFSGEHREDNHPCEGKAHNTNNQSNRNHAECKIMHHAANDAKNVALETGIWDFPSLTMRINWNNKGELSNSPCGGCMGSICEVALQCNMKIYICWNDPRNADIMYRSEAPCRKVVHRPGSQKQGPGGRGHSNNWEGGPDWRAVLS